MEWCLPGAGEGEDGESLFNGYRVSVLQNEKCSGCGGGGGYITMQKYLIPLNCTLKID